LRDEALKRGAEIALAHPGIAERALELMCKRLKERVAFGRPLAEQGVTREWIADSRVVVFEHLSHAGLHEDPDEFNAATLEFLLNLPG